MKKHPLPLRLLIPKSLPMKAAIYRAMNVAGAKKEPVRFVFNGVELEARPGESFVSIVGDYEEKTRPKPRGGKRAGAGRKPSPNSEPMASVKVPVRIIEAAKAQKARGGANSSTMQGILTQWLDAGRAKCQQPLPNSADFNLECHGQALSRRKYVGLDKAIKKQSTSVKTKGAK